MIYDDDESKYKQVIDTLKQLPGVEAPPHFQADLMRRINSGKFESKVKQGFWEKLLVPSKLVPSAALGLMAIIMLFVINTSSVEQDDPLTFTPALREDAAESAVTGVIVIPENSGQNTIRSARPQTASFAGVSSVNRSGFNFKQVNLTEAERKQLNKLKEKLKSYFQEKPAEKVQK